MPRKRLKDATEYVPANEGDPQELLRLESAERVRLQRHLDLRNAALDSARSHVMIIDASGARWSIVYANRAVAEDHGYEPGELLGRSPAMLARLVDNREAFRLIYEAAREFRSISIELIARRRNGSTFRVGMFLTPMRDLPGAVRHYVAIAADITARLEQERAQQQLRERLLEEMRERERMAIELRLAQKLESVGRLAAGVAHEINTPIQFIGDSLYFLQSATEDLHRLLQGYRGCAAAGGGAGDATGAIAQLEREIDAQFLSHEIPKAFTRTLEGLERVTAIVRAMKEFAHPDGVEHSSADLNHAVRTTLTVSHNEYKYYARIETTLGELPPVICNIGEMNQVFLNLIVNAAHAIHAAGKSADEGRINIATRASDAQVEISITDNGCGIPPENLEKIFDPFFTTKPVGLGTGQGLAIARSIVSEKHGGTIEVDSVVGRGTRFVLRIPIAGRRRERLV